MSSLDQDEIDRILFFEQERQRKLNLRLSAIEKLQLMFKEVMGMEYTGEFETMDDIASYIGLMEFEMKPNMQYYEDFMRLSHSYDRKSK